MNWYKTTIQQLNQQQRQTVISQPRTISADATALFMGLDVPNDGTQSLQVHTPIIPNKPYSSVAFLKPYTNNRELQQILEAGESSEQSDIIASSKRKSAISSYPTSNIVTVQRSAIVANSKIRTTLLAGHQSAEEQARNSDTGLERTYSFVGPVLHENQQSMNPASSASYYEENPLQNSKNPANDRMSSLTKSVPSHIQHQIPQTQQNMPSLVQPITHNVVISQQRVSDQPFLQKQINQSMVMAVPPKQGVESTQPPMRMPHLNPAMMIAQQQQQQQQFPQQFIQQPPQFANSRDSHQKPNTTNTVRTQDTQNESVWSQPQRRRTRMILQRIPEEDERGWCGCCLNPTVPPENGRSW